MIYLDDMCNLVMDKDMAAQSKVMSMYNVLSVPFHQGFSGSGEVSGLLAGGRNASHRDLYTSYVCLLCLSLTQCTMSRVWEYLG